MELFARSEQSRELDDLLTELESRDLTNVLTQSCTGTILLAVGTHQTCLATRLDPRLAASVSTSTGPHSNGPVTAGGLGIRLRTPLSWIATRRHTPGGALLVGSGELTW